MGRMKIYIAGPLFSDAEKEYNKKVAEFLENLGYDTFLPQRDGYLVTELEKRGLSSKEIEKMIFDLDVNEIKKSDVILFVMDGRVPDEGACVEVGIGYALGKKCIGLKTDPRTLFKTQDNPLIKGCLKSRIAKNLDQLKNYLVD